jgi:hypothetical protein
LGGGANVDEVVNADRVFAIDLWRNRGEHARSEVVGAGSAAHEIRGWRLSCGRCDHGWLSGGLLRHGRVIERSAGANGQKNRSEGGTNAAHGCSFLQKPTPTPIAAIAVRCQRAREEVSDNSV